MLGSLNFCVAAGMHQTLDAELLYICFIQFTPNTFGFSWTEILSSFAISKTFNRTVDPAITKRDFYSIFPSHTFFLVIYLIKNKIYTFTITVISIQPFSPLPSGLKIKFGPFLDGIHLTQLFESLEISIFYGYI